MIDEPIHVTDDAFEKAVLQSDIPVLVDFWAPWCSPCKMIAPTLEKIAKQHAGKLLVAKVNTDENPKWTEKFEVRGIPTMLLISGGNVIHRQIGALPEPFIFDMVNEFLSTVDEAIA